MQTLSIHYVSMLDKEGLCIPYRGGLDYQNFLDETTKTEFHIAFFLNRMDVFSINYYRLNIHQNPYFSTTAFRFNRNKSDWFRGGQAQEVICTGLSKIFYKKWNYYHLHDLTDKQYWGIRTDIQELMKTYPFLLSLPVNLNGNYILFDLSFDNLKNKSMTIYNKRR